MWPRDRNLGIAVTLFFDAGCLLMPPPRLLLPGSEEREEWEINYELVSPGVAHKGH